MDANELHNLNKLLGYNQVGGGLASILSGMFGNSSSPYNAARGQMDRYFPQSMDYMNQAQGYMNNNYYQPYYDAGNQAIPQYQNWLNKMQDPTQFINNTMNQYQESPWAKFQQDQSMHAARNIGSTGALGGINSTPMTQFAQQNARDISSQDMNQWLGNVMGINRDYGSGLHDLYSGGLNAAGGMTQQNMFRSGLSQEMANFLNQHGIDMAGLAYGNKAGHGQNTNNFLGGLGAGLSGLLSIFG